MQMHLIHPFCQVEEDLTVQLPNLIQITEKLLSQIYRHLEVCKHHTNLRENLQIWWEGNWATATLKIQGKWTICIIAGHTTPQNMRIQMPILLVQMVEQFKILHPEAVVVFNIHHQEEVVVIEVDPPQSHRNQSKWAANQDNNKIRIILTSPITLHRTAVVEWVFTSKLPCKPTHLLIQIAKVQSTMEKEFLVEPAEENSIKTHCKNIRKFVKRYLSIREKHLISKRQEKLMACKRSKESNSIPNHLESLPKRRLQPRNQLEKCLNGSSNH